VTRPVPITFGAWEPDKATFQSDALVDALNVLPVAGGYGPMSGFSLVDGASLATPITGATVLSDYTASTSIYAGSDDDVHLSLNGAAFVSVYSHGSALDPLNRWRYARFVGKVIAVHPEVAPIADDLGSTTGMTGLGGTPPAANAIGVVSNFLVLGNLDDGIDGLRPNRIRWSGFNDPDAWGTDPGTQADFNDMPDEGGAVQAIIGREFGTVFQRYSVSRMEYVGPPTVFAFGVVEKKRGAIAPGAVIDAGLVAFYIADDGFFLWDGTSSTPIGAGRVDEYFRRRLYPGSADMIVGAFDPLSSSVMWAYPTDSSGTLSEALIYSFTENRWTRSDLRSSWLMSGFDVGQTLEDMDAYGSLEAIPFSFDDPSLLGGNQTVVGFDEDGNYGSLNGATLPGVLETGDWQAAPGMRAFVNAVRPIVDANTVTCAVGVRQQSMADPIVYSSESSRAIDGRCPLRASGRLMRIRQTIAGTQSWTRATGVEASVAAEGRR